MRQDIEALESTTFGGKRFTRKQLCDIQTTVEWFPALSLRELGQTVERTGSQVLTCASSKQLLWSWPGHCG
jgi:hypothetical protein